MTSISDDVLEREVASLGEFIPKPVIESNHDTLVTLFKESLSQNKSILDKCQEKEALKPYAEKIDAKAQKFSQVTAFSLAADIPSIIKAAERYYSKEIELDKSLGFNPAPTVTGTRFFKKLWDFHENTIKKMVGEIYPNSDDERNKLFFILENLFRRGCQIKNLEGETAIQDFFHELAKELTPLSAKEMPQFRDFIKWAIHNYYYIKFQDAEDVPSLAKTALIYFDKEIREDEANDAALDTHNVFYPYISQEDEKKTKDLIAAVFPNGTFVKTTEDTILKVLLRAANNGKVYSNHTLKSFIEIFSLPFFNIQGNSLNSLRQLISHVSYCINRIKSERAALFTERDWVKRFVLFKKIDESAPACKERSEFLRDACLGCFAHIAEITKSESSQTGRQVSPLQGSLLQYFRDYEKDNVLLASAHEKMVELLNSKDRKEPLKPTDIFLTSDEAIKKSQKTHFHYMDLDKIPEGELEERILKYLKKDHINIRYKAFPSLYFGFKVAVKDDQDLKSIADAGVELEKKTNKYRQLIQEIIDKFVVSKFPSRSKSEHEQFKANLYSKIIFTGTTKVMGMPIIHIPRLAPANVNLDEDRRLLIFKTREINQAGKTPTIQKVTSFLSKVMDFTEIWSKAYTLNLSTIEGSILTEISAQEQSKILPKTLSELITSSTFTELQKYIETTKTTFPGLALACQAVVNGIKGLAAKENFEKDLIKKMKEMKLPDDFLMKSFGRVLDAISRQFATKHLHENYVDLIFEELLLWLNLNPIYDQKKTEELFVKEQFSGFPIKPDFVQMTRGGQDALDTYFKVIRKSKQTPAGTWEQLSSISSKSGYFEAEHQIKESSVYSQSISLTYPFKENLLKHLEELNKKIIHKEKEKKDIEAAIAAGNAGLADQLKVFIKDLEELKNRRIDELVVDFHSSPDVKSTVSEDHDVSELVDILKKSGWAAKELWVRVDLTIDDLHSTSAAELITKNPKHQEDYLAGKLHFVFVKSAVKFMGLSFDRLTGGFLEVFSKNKEVIDRFEKYKKLAPIDTHNIQGYGMLLEFATPQIEGFSQQIFNNAKEVLSRIQPEYFYQKGKRKSDQKSIYVVLPEDPKKSKTYYVQVQCESDDLFKIFCKLLGEELRKRGLNVFDRDGFSYLNTVTCSLESTALRISVGGEGLEQMKGLADAINATFIEAEDRDLL